MSQTFMDKVLAGRASADQIDDYVDKWHRSPGDTPLAAFLGLTPSEFNRWVADALVIHRIVEERRE